MSEVCAVLVTYNRLALLKESIAAILQQNVPVKQLLIIDNQSTDGTGDYLTQFADDARVTVVTASTNLGGAGGFQLGIDQAMQAGDYDYVWIMDDDTIPTEDCLSKLLDPIATGKISNKGFVCSNVRWTDNSVAIMNIPYVSQNWNGVAQDGLVQVDAASFVSLLVPTATIAEIGLPIKEFFVWGDDHEYTLRISERYESYCVGDSIAIHKMAANHGVDIVTDDPGRIGRYFYNYRNAYYTERKHHGAKGALTQIAKDLYAIHKVLHRSADHKWRRIHSINKGMLAGFTFRPQIQFSQRK
ncbi:glycosyltransferase family 2 protein [Furfurilactobacillus sp. WILCCON 0119]|uniref:glycosyltransferase family 2 protein n=1 Tax=Furfurilactobacillus entadae TaxID=2922307 RepID=UPI0035EC9F15